MVLRVSRRYRAGMKRAKRISEIDIRERKRRSLSFREKKRGGIGGGMSIVNKYYGRCLSLGLRLISGCDVLAKNRERERS